LLLSESCAAGDDGHRSSQNLESRFHLCFLRYYRLIKIEND
jgi:hypothetical protein